MNILFLCHRFPFPPTSGAKIRSFNMIRHLASQHEVTVASIAHSAGERAEAAGLAQHGARYSVHRVVGALQVLRMIARVPTRSPSSLAYFYTPSLANEVHAQLEHNAFDLVIGHSSSVAQYLEGVDGVAKLMDFCDMDSQKWLDYGRHKRFPLGLAYALEGRKLAAEEVRIARQFHLCTVATPAELCTFNAQRSGVEAGWFPNGVDSEHFRPAAAPYKPDRIVFVGKMDYYPNEECMVRFCSEVLPELRAKRPGVKLAIVGADPSSAVRRLARYPGVTVTGTVPDVRPHVLDAAVMVAPLAIARGTQNKILEGMAMGIPVVASPIAAGGIDAEAPEHLLIAASPSEQVQAILRILDDPRERCRLAASGRARVLSHHAWSESMRRFDGLIERCLAIASSPRRARAA